jgi:hypothetical protein
MQKQSQEKAQKAQKEFLEHCKRLSGADFSLVFSSFVLCVPFLGYFKTPS